MEPAAYGREHDRTLSGDLQAKDPAMEPAAYGWEYEGVQRAFRAAVAPAMEPAVMRPVVFGREHPRRMGHHHPGRGCCNEARHFRAGAPGSSRFDVAESLVLQ